MTGALMAAPVAFVVGVVAGLFLSSRFRIIRRQPPDGE